jgi:hypothetical protein
MAEDGKAEKAGMEEEGKVEDGTLGGDGNERTRSGGW